ncbi:MAG TPA: hypothetical protein DDZ41_12400, partial [Flavobacterium sp.]|nr:hypothetical protein [Flavobacterium sp.]
MLINPSAKGWIKKFFSQNKSNYKNYNTDMLSFYYDMRASGFIYGHVIQLNLLLQPEKNELSNDEVTKIALLNALYSTFKLVTQIKDEAAFIEKAVEFYKFLHHKETLLFLKSNPDLEDCIATRIQTNENILAKNFSHILTNALLFMDVLAFKKFLEYNENPINYLKKLEESIILLVSNTLHIKE